MTSTLKNAVRATHNTIIQTQCADVFGYILTLREERESGEGRRKRKGQCTFTAERERQTDTDRERDRQTDRLRDRDRQTDRQTEAAFYCPVKRGGWVVGVIQRESNCIVSSLEARSVTSGRTERKGERQILTDRNLLQVRQSFPTDWKGDRQKLTAEDVLQVGLRQSFYLTTIQIPGLARWQLKGRWDMNVNGIEHDDDNTLQISPVWVIKSCRHCPVAGIDNVPWRTDFLIQRRW